MGLTVADSLKARMIRIFRYDKRGNPVEELITIEDAAAQLAVSQARVSQLLANGDFTRHPLSSRCVLVSKDEVEAYAASDRKPGRKATLG